MELSLVKFFPRCLQRLSNGFNVFSSPGSLVIGDDVGIGEYAYICAVAPVTIGSDTIVGQYLSIHPQNHHFQDKSSLIRHQGTSELERKYWSQLLDWLQGDFSRRLLGRCWICGGRRSCGDQGVS